MKITTLVAAIALATASTSAIAQNADVTTTDGDIVMIEKNQTIPLWLINFAVFGGFVAVGSQGGS